jgi:spermidine synthase
VYGGSFYVMQWMVQSLTPTEGGYAAFNVASHAIAIAVMFPAAFCAGMTLPLITKTLLRSGSGERAIGQVYAANTAGSILGVLAAVHLGLPLLGVKGLIIVAAAIDLALGVVLLGIAPSRLRYAFAAGALAVSAAAVLYAGLAVQIDPHHMASGVYRRGILLAAEKYQLLHHEDGKTTTVSVTLSDSNEFSLRNNGKSDGSLSARGVPTGDEATMVLLGALPVLMMPEAQRIANIGFGTGLTAHALLASEKLQVLDTIEIEPAVVRGARHLKPHNARAFDDPRSRVHVEDAKTFFSIHQVRYDVIISEPSNPWVSGVSSLFSSEFYRHAKRYLKPGGLFVQWVQLYEFSPPLLASVIEALRPEFSDYVVWAANGGDLIIVAANGGRVPELRAEALERPAMAAMLERFRIRTLDDLLLHRIGGRRVMDAYFRSFAAEPNSDFFPVIDINGAKARFMQLRATGAIALSEAPLPLLDLFEPGYMPDPSRITSGERIGELFRATFASTAASAARYLLDGDPKALKSLARGPAGDLTMLRAALLECRFALPEGAVPEALGEVARLVNSALPREQATAVWRALESSRCLSRIEPADRTWIRLYAAVAARDAAAMAEVASRLLAEQDLKPDFRAYALAALMAGRILTGERGLAVKAFQEHRGKLGQNRAWQPIFTFLSAHAFGSVYGVAEQ